MSCGRALPGGFAEKLGWDAGIRAESGEHCEPVEA